MHLIFLLFSLCGLSLSAAPKELWKYECKGSMPLYCQIDKNNSDYLFVCQKNGGFEVLKLANSGARSIATLSKKDLLGLDCINLQQRGSIVYLALGDFFKPSSKMGVATVDVRNPARPKLMGSWVSPQEWRGCHHVEIDGRYAYLSGMNFGVVVVDISKPRKMKFVSRYLPDKHFPRKNPNSINRPNVRHTVARGNLLYVAYDAGGVRVLDKGDPKNLKEVGRYINTKMRKKNQAYNELLIHGETVFAAVDYGGLEILKIRGNRLKQVAWWNPWEAETMKNIWFNSPGHTNQLNYNVKLKHLYISAGDSELLALNVSNPKKPKLVWQFGAVKNKRGAWGAHWYKDTIYLTYIKTIVPFKSSFSGVKAVLLK